MLQVRCIVVLEHRTLTQVGLVIFNTETVALTRAIFSSRFFFFCVCVSGNVNHPGDQIVHLDLTCALSGLAFLEVYSATLASDICPVDSISLQSWKLRTPNE